MFKNNNAYKADRAIFYGTMKLLTHEKYLDNTKRNTEKQMQQSLNKKCF